MAANRWISRLWTCLLLSMPLGLLLVWGGLLYVSHYGIAPQGVVPEYDWSTDRLLAWMADPSHPEEHRYRARQLLGRRNPKVVEQLIPLLKHPDAVTRRLAAQTLGDLGAAASAAIPDLLELAYAEDPEVSTAAFLAAVHIAPLDESVLESISDALRTNRVILARAAVVALGQLDPAPLNLVMEGMAHQDKETARLAATVFRRQRLKSPQVEAVLPVLEQWLFKLTDVHDSPIREVLEAYRPYLRPLLRKVARQHSVPAVRLLVLEELVRLPGESLEEFVPDLKGLALSPEDPEIRQQALSVLTSMRHAGVPALRELMASSNEQTRFAATLIVAELEEGSASTDLLTSWLLNTKEDEIRARCIFLLGFRGLEATEAIPVMERCRNHPMLGDITRHAIGRLVDPDSKDHRP